MEHSHQHSVPRSRAVLLVAAGLAVVTLCASALRSLLSQDPLYPTRVAAVFGLVAAVAFAGLRAHPFARLGPANVVTGARTMVMALLAGAATGPGIPASGWLVVLIAAAGAAADALDGPLARRSGLASRFGARFDMEVDALLILVLSALVWRVAPVGAWVLASGLMRYAFVAAGWLLPWMAVDLPPSRRRQAVCVVQIVGLIVALSPLVTPAAASAVAVTGLALLTWSFAVDTRWLFLHR
jgi:phosphatidylglycerophosphate synthase